MTHFKKNIPFFPEIQRIKEINVEGVILPNEPLTNFELIEAVKKLKINNLNFFPNAYIK